MSRPPLPMRRPPLPSRIVSHVPTYRTIRALVPTDARSRFNRYEPAMTIATAANAVTPTPNTVTPTPQYGHAVSRKRHNHYHGSHQYCRVGYTCSRVAHRQCRVVHKCFRVRPKLSHGGRRQCKGKHLASGIVIYTNDKSTSNRQLPMSSSNSVGVAISQPRVEVRSTSTLGKDKKRESNAVSIADRKSVV